MSERRKDANFVSRTKILSRAKRAVLLVDPSPDALRRVQGMLKGYDFELLWAPETGRANAILRSRPVACVITNSDLPDTDPLEFIEGIPRKDGATPTPVILIVGDTNAQTVLRAKELGVSEILLQPVDATRLRKGLAKALFEKNS